MPTLQSTDPSNAPTFTPNKSWVRNNLVVDLLLLVFRPRAVSGDSPTVAWIKRHPLLVLFGLAYGLTWIGLIPLVTNPELTNQYRPGQVSLSIIILAFFGVGGCLWAAVAVATATGGMAGRYALLRGYLKWRVGIQWYLVVLLSPALFLLTAIGLDVIVAGKLPAAPALSLAPAALFSSYGVWMVKYMMGNWEEICWRGSALPRLQAKHSALVASLIVGVVHGLWHLPYVFVRGHFVQTIGLPAMILLSVAMGIVFTWVYNNTRASLLMVALFHAAYDAWSALQGNDATLFYLMIGVWCVVAIVLVAIFGAKHLSRKAESEIAPAIYTTG